MPARIKRRKEQNPLCSSTLLSVKQNINQISANVNSFFVFFGKNTDENGESI